MYSRQPCCKCGLQWDYPIRLSMRTALTEYTDTELWSELYRRGTRPQEDQSVGVTGPTGLRCRAELPQAAPALRRPLLVLSGTSSHEKARRCPARSRAPFSPGPPRLLAETDPIRADGIAARQLQVLTPSISGTAGEEASTVRRQRNVPADEGSCLEFPLVRALRLRERSSRLVEVGLKAKEKSQYEPTRTNDASNSQRHDGNRAASVSVPARQTHCTPRLATRQTRRC